MINRFDFGVLVGFGDFGEDEKQWRENDSGWWVEACVSEETCGGGVGCTIGEGNDKQGKDIE